MRPRHFSSQVSREHTRLRADDQCCLDSVDFLDLVGVGRYPAPAVHVTTHGRSGHDHHTLPVRPGPVPRPLYPQLDLPILHRGLLPTILPAGPHHRRHHPDSALLRFLLYLLQQVSGFDHL